MTNSRSVPAPVDGPMKLRRAVIAIAAWLLVPLLVPEKAWGHVVDAPYRFDLLRFEVGAGPTSSFVDDFSDGLRDWPPTFYLMDSGASVTTEQGGRLVFTDVDGATVLGHPSGPGLYTGLDDMVFLAPTQPYVYLDGGGDVVYTATWGATVPNSAGVLSRFIGAGFGLLNVVVPGDDPTIYIALGSFAAIQATNLPSGCDTSGPLFLVQEFDRQLPGNVLTYACDGIDPSSVSGPIVMRLAFDDAADAITFSYSLDGGSSFVPASAWDVATGPVVPAAGMANRALVPIAEAQVTQVPSLPGPGWLVAVALLLTTLAFGRGPGRGRGRSEDRSSSI